jgi:hypothetical protein
MPTSASRHVVAAVACWLMAGTPHAESSPASTLVRAFEQVPANAAGDEALVNDVNPWHYWGAEFDFETRRAEPQAWRETDDVIDGWDWSLPPHVTPAAIARMRFGWHGWQQGIDTFNPPDGLTVVDELWVRWREIEEVEGQYDFSHIKTQIADRLEQGCDGVILRMLGAVWTTAAPADWERWEQQNEPWRFQRWSAPRWLVETYGVDKLVAGEGRGEVIHVDIFHPDYDRQYRELIDAFDRSGLLDMPEVHGLIVGGMCQANGEEGHGTYELSNVPRDRAEAIYRQRLSDWQDAFGDPHRVVAMIHDGLTLVGSRDGFVEMYLYHANDPQVRGQFVDEAGYLSVNEEAFYIRHGDKVIFGDENEEYSPERWADRPGRPGRFGPVESFNYRYFTSMLRLLQMRRNYLYAGEQAIQPHLLWYVLHGLGRTTRDAPDAWCFLRESEHSGGGQNAVAGTVKNYERWLYQRDRSGYETESAIEIPHALKDWWLADKKHRYDHVARRGERIGFNLDEAFLSGSARVALKVTFYDGYDGDFRLRYRSGGEPRETEHVAVTGTDAFRTATFFIDADFGPDDDGFDFEIVSPARVPISFVRIVKTQKEVPHE